MKICPFCFRQSSERRCPACGGEIDFSGHENQLPVGTKLNGNVNASYLLGASIGQGGFGVTYAALNPATMERVAIKEYFPGCWSKRSGNRRDILPISGYEKAYEKGRNDFLREARQLVSLKAFPSIVKVKDCFMANGTAYIVMEYLEGETLAKRVQRKGPFLWQELIPRLNPLLEDIHSIHVMGVMHRDIAPDNIMVLTNGSLKLMDFGSARKLQSTPEGKTVFIKPGFSPVEQYVRAAGQGPFTDVYAMAATIDYCLCGIVPPASTDRLMALSNYDADPMKNPQELGVSIPGNVQKALLRALAIRSEERTQSIQEFRDQLCPPRPKSTPLSFREVRLSENQSDVELCWQGDRPTGASFYLLRRINAGNYRQIAKRNRRNCTDRLPLFAQSAQYRLELRKEDGTVLAHCESQPLSPRRKRIDFQQHLGVALLGIAALVLLAALIVALCA